MNTTMTDRNTSESHAAPAMERMRYARRFCRTTALVAVMMLLNAVIWPSWAVAVEVERQKEAQAQARWEARHQSLDQVLLGIRQEAQDGRSMMADTLAERNQGFLGKARSLLGIEQATAEALPRLQWLSQRAANLHEQALASFDETEAHLRKKDLPRRILDRNDLAREEYQRAYATMRETLNQALDSNSLGEQEEALAALVDFMDRFTLDKPRDPFDPNKLPWRTPDPDKTPTPARSAEALSQRTGLPRFEQGLELASLNNNVALSVAPGAPTDEALAATLDAPQTPAIQAKAAELDHDPVRIYQWVRNNIEFIPSYGSIQGAEYTLELGKGNAFDTASLLIALLRASDIPARYAMGTVRIPADQVMNWVGGVNVPSAAGNLMGQGGIPNTGLTRGGQISHFELEHIWVEAWIDFHPSRGADHRTGDTWVPMDASFKQYEYSEGMDLQDKVPFDAEGLARTIEQESTINEEEGWVQGVPQQPLEDALADYRAQLETYLDSQAPEATVGEVLGTQNIKTVIHKQLAAGLPYELATRKLVVSELSDNLRWKFRYQLFTSQYGRQGSQLISVERPTAALAGHKLALSFKPASQEDEETLASYLPDPDENGEIDPNQIPGTLPGYLIDLTGEFTIGNDEVVLASSNTAMGTGLQSEMGYWQPNRGWQTSQNEPVAGEYRALALNLQGISQNQAKDLQSDLENTRQDLKRGEVGGLTKNNVLGALLYSSILNYMGLNDFQDRLSEKKANSVGYRAPSYGLFKNNLQSQYWYGIPRNVKAVGLTMDVDNMSSLRVDKMNNEKKWQGFNRVIGARMSAMEHLVPEKLYSTEDIPAHGISAVKAIQLAAEEGQKIWTIDITNLGVALASLQLSSETEADIRDAVRTGKIVTAHEKPVDFFGQKTTGYIIQDPETGAGAYLIGQGENGGLLTGLGYVINTLTYFYGFVESYAKYAGTKLPILGKIVRYLEIAKFAHSLIANGLECMSNYEAVAYVMSLFAILSLLIVNLVLTFTNPLAAFATGAALDVGFSWLVSQSGNCR